MIRCSGVTLSFQTDRPALHSIDLVIRQGEMVGLLGPNGSGKTTLLNAVCGAIAPQKGDVLVHGENIRRLSAKKRAQIMAFVPQRSESVPDFSAFDLVLMGRYPHRKFLEGYTPEDKAIAQRSLEETAVSHLAARSVKTLSGGERQRVLVARAFAQQTKILLLDEAATGLDPAHATAVFDQTRRRNRAHGVTTIAAIHDLNLAALYCDRLVFLKNGAIAADGPVREIFTPHVLHHVYDAPFFVMEHPELHVPQALPLPGGYRA